MGVSFQKIPGRGGVAAGLFLLLLAVQACSGQEPSDESDLLSEEEGEIGGFGFAEPEKLVSVTDDAADTTPPTLLEFSYTPISVDTSVSAQNVTFNLRVTDDLSGVSHLRWYVKSPTGEMYNMAWLDSSRYRTSGDSLDGVYQYTWQFPRYSEGGIWRIYHLCVIDKATNSRCFTSEAEIKAGGFPTELNVTGMTDNSPPNPVELDYTPKTIDTGAGDQSVVVTVRLTEDLSGVRYAQTGFRGPSGQWVYMTMVSPTNRISGDGRDGVYQVKGLFPRYSEAGRWRLYYFTAYDNALNYRYFSETDLKANGFPTEITNGATVSDISPPDVAEFDYTPKSVDVSAADQTVVFTTRLTDNLAGVSYLRWMYASPSGKQSFWVYVYPYNYGTLTSQISGNALDGVYKKGVVFPRYSEAGTWHINNFCMSDNVRNMKCLTEADLKARGFITETKVVQCASASAELCGDKIDNDCDGAIDEGFDAGTLCVAGVGACQVSGVKVCSADGTGTRCNAVAGTPAGEVCGDKIDNDCDGLTDEGANNEADCKAAEAAKNSPPAADAGANILCDGINDVAEGKTIFLDGLCTDTDAGDSLTGTWTQNGGGTSCGTIDDTPSAGEEPLTVAADCVAPDVSANENESFQLKCDDGAASATDDVTVCVNAKPAALAQSVSTKEDTEVTIFLKGNDPNNETLSYSLLAGPVHGTLVGEPPVLVYTPSVNYHGEDSFTFKASDRIQSGDSADVSISIGSVNDIPVACAGSDQTARPPVVVTLDGSCSKDADGDSLAFKWTQTAGKKVFISDEESARPTIEPTGVGTYTFSLVVNDGTIDSNPDLVNITVYNVYPVADPIGDQRVYPGGSIALACHGTDANKDSLSYVWNQLSGPSLPARFPVTTSEFSVTAPNVNAESAVVLSCIVRDGRGGFSTSSLKVIIGVGGATTGADEGKIASTSPGPSTVEEKEEGVVIETAREAWSLPSFAGDILLPTTSSGPIRGKGDVAWEMVAGPDALVFEGAAINMTDYLYKRGTYQIRERTIDEEGMVRYFEPVTITIPNNPPLPPSAEKFDFGPQKGDISRESAAGKKRFVYEGYSNVISFSSVFDDPDDDQLTYHWTAADEGMRVVTGETGEVALWNRKAGTRGIVVTVEDGQGGKTEEVIEFYVPPPELDGESASLSITGRKSTGEETQTVTGEIQSPVIPIIRVNEVSAKVDLVKSGSSSLVSAGVMALAIGAGSFDAYSFTAEGVPADTGLDIDVLTDVDGEAVPLFSKTVTGDSARIETGAGPVGTGGGCSLVR